MAEPEAESFAASTQILITAFDPDFGAKCSLCLAELDQRWQTIGSKFICDCKAVIYCTFDCWNTARDKHAPVCADLKSALANRFTPRDRFKVPGHFKRRRLAVPNGGETDRKEPRVADFYSL